MLEELQREHTVVGMKQVSRSIREGKEISRIYIAQDADQGLIEKIIHMAKEHDLDIVKIESRKKLGKMCAIDVGATVVAVIK